MNVILNTIFVRGSFIDTPSIEASSNDSRSLMDCSLRSSSLLFTSASFFAILCLGCYFSSDWSGKTIEVCFLDWWRCIVHGLVFDDIVHVLTCQFDCTLNLAPHLLNWRWFVLCSIHLLRKLVHNDIYFINSIRILSTSRSFLLVGRSDKHFIEVWVKDSITEMIRQIRFLHRIWVLWRRLWSIRRKLHFKLWMLWQEVIRLHQLVKSLQQIFWIIF